jgi:hypothetical protein
MCTGCLVLGHFYSTVAGSGYCTADGAYHCITKRRATGLMSRWQLCILLSNGTHTSIGIVWGPPKR